MTFYLSVEQEAVLNDHFPDEIRQSRLDQFYIVVSKEPWGCEGPDWTPTMIGPMRQKTKKDAQQCGRSMESVHNLLVMLGHKVVVSGSEQGTWHMGGCYKPDACELSDTFTTNFSAN